MLEYIGCLVLALIVGGLACTYAAVLRSHEAVNERHNRNQCDSDQPAMVAYLDPIDPCGHRFYARGGAAALA